MDGGEFPASFVAQGQPLAIEQGANAAGKGAVVIYQRNQPLAALNGLLHAGGGALGLVFKVRGCVQAHGGQGGRILHSGLWFILCFILRFIPLQHADGLRALGGKLGVQGVRQWVGLQAVEHQQGL